MVKELTLYFFFISLTEQRFRPQQQTSRYKKERRNNAGGTNYFPFLVMILIGTLLFNSNIILLITHNCL